MKCRMMEEEDGSCMHDGISRRDRENRESEMRLAVEIGRVGSAGVRGIAVQIGRIGRER